MKLKLESLVALVAALVSCGVAINVRAQNSPDCSPYGDLSADVTTRVKAVRAGRVLPGPAVRLRRKPTATCDDERSCYYETFPANHSSEEGIEIRRNEAWVCVALPGKRPLDVWVGWLPAQRWQAAASESTQRSWVGVWQNYNSKLWIKPSGSGKFAVRGDAIWAGAGAPRFGAFSFTASSEDGLLVTPPSLEVDPCQVALRIVGAFIYGADNGKCGAPNVTFDGAYRFRPGLE